MLNLIIRTIVFYLSVFILFTIIYILLFHTPLFQYQKVLFYRGLLLLIPATLLVTIILTLIAYHWRKIRYDLIIAAVLISISLNLTFFTISPVSIERSVTISLLNRLNDDCSGTTCAELSKKDIENYLYEIYLKKNKAVEKRVNEQSIIGTVNKHNEKISLTKKGENLLEISTLIKKIYNIQ